jgi:peptidoglycan-N-acetylglucosamine deacetylase
MSSTDDGSPASPVARALASAAMASYLLPGLAAWIWPSLRAPLGLEERTSSGAGYALTFDDGPHPLGTPAVLEILESHAISATFFLVGEQVRRNPSLVREIVGAGHGVGLHCDRHRNQLRLTPWQVREDISRAQDTIEEATDRAIELYRPPYGVLNSSALRVARRNHWRTLLWSHFGKDWEAGATPESIAALVTKDAGEGSVLLLHDADDYSAPGSWRRTAAALPRVLDLLASRGLQAVAP